jgi:hypothetical protein
MKSIYLPLIFITFTLSACTGLTGPVIMGADAVGIYTTKPKELPPADTQAQIPPHQSWCYSTMADIECYTQEQNVVPARLVNVEPQSAYPLDAHAYRQLLVPKPKDVVSAEPSLSVQPVVVAVPDVQLEKAKLKEEINGDSGASSPSMPQPLLPPIVH